MLSGTFASGGGLNMRTKDVQNAIAINTVGQALFAVLQQVLRILEGAHERLRDQADHWRSIAA